jgi:hypothetical protein
MSPARPFPPPPSTVCPGISLLPTAHYSLPTFSCPLFSCSYESLFPPNCKSGPLFSGTYKLLGGQLLSFDNDLRCPLVWRQHFQFSALDHEPPRKSFVYCFCADSRSKSFIYRIYAKYPGVGIPDAPAGRPGGGGTPPKEPASESGRYESNQTRTLRADAACSATTREARGGAGPMVAGS